MTSVYFNVAANVAGHSSDVVHKKDSSQTETETQLNGRFV